MMFFKYVLILCFAGSERCPVRTFVKYIKMLNPKCQSLFQQPRNEPKDGVFYNNVPIGHNKLGKSMTEMS